MEGKYVVCAECGEKYLVTSSIVSCPKCGMSKIICPACGEKYNTKLCRNVCPKCGDKTVVLSEGVQYNAGVTETKSVESVAPVDNNQAGDNYSVNPAAEGVASTIASIALAIGIIGLIVGIILDISIGLDGTAVVGGILSFVVGLEAWAVIKVFVNMSRNLFKINDKLDKIIERKKTE